MAFNLIITSRASLDTIEASIYYESRQNNLSIRFLSELNNVYETLKQSPQLYSFISTRRKLKLRDIKVKGFPYLVIFGIIDDNVVVYSVFNSYKKPKYK